MGGLDCKCSLSTHASRLRVGLVAAPVGGCSFDLPSVSGALAIVPDSGARVTILVTPRLRFARGQFRISEFSKDLVEAAGVEPFWRVSNNAAKTRIVGKRADSIGFIARVQCSPVLGPPPESTQVGEKWGRRFNRTAQCRKERKSMALRRVAKIEGPGRDRRPEP
jgi:hypothetical protein